MTPLLLSTILVFLHPHTTLISLTTIYHHLLDDEWLNGDASASHSLLYQAAEMQDINPVTLSCAVTLDSSPPLLAARLEPIYESNEDSPPPAQCSKCACKNKIMALPADSWNKKDFIDIYGSASKDDGFPQMCSSVLHSLICPHDLPMAALVPTASSYINMCGSICPCNENHCNCSKCVHRQEGFMNHWILDSGASMHFTPHRDALTTYHKFSKDEHLPVQTATSTIFCGRKRYHSTMVD